MVESMLPVMSVGYRMVMCFSIGQNRQNFNASSFESLRAMNAEFTFA